MDYSTLDILTLTNHYAQQRLLVDTKEAEFKVWKAKLDSSLGALNAEILKRLQAENKTKLETAAGRFNITTKYHISTSKMEDFTTWLKEDPSRLDYATVKPRSAAIKTYVNENGEAPSGVSYDRLFEISFTKAS